MIRVWMSLLATVLSVSWLSAGTDEPAAPPHKEFVVHEWAVWVKSHSPKGTVLSSPAELTAGLPKFVQVAKNSVQTRPVENWDKPVLHLYGDEGQKVSVKVTAQQGLLSAYWPAGKLETHDYNEPPPPGWKLPPGQKLFAEKPVVVKANGIEWSGTLHAKSTDQLEEASKDHWWSAVREVPSMYFVAGKECERFLFYEATAQQEPAVTAKISDDQLKLANSDSNPAEKVMVIVNSGDKRYCRLVDSIEANGEATISKADFLAKESTEEQLLEACRGHWRQFGMTDAEAKAIVQSCARTCSARGRCW